LFLVYVHSEFCFRSQIESNPPSPISTSQNNALDCSRIIAPKSVLGPVSPLQEIPVPPLFGVTLTAEPCNPATRETQLDTKFHRNYFKSAFLFRPFKVPFNLLPPNLSPDPGLNRSSPLPPLLHPFPLKPLPYPHPELSLIVKERTKRNQDHRSLQYGLV